MPSLSIPSSVLALGACLVLGALPAEAQNATTPGALELYPNLAAVGVRLFYTGDADSDATARVEWRPQGSGPWTPGLSMTRIAGSRWAASVLWLTPDTPYEIRAVVDDPDGGGSAAGLVRTRSEAPLVPTGRTWWVAPTGSDSANGTSQSPLRTLQAAADRAQPGEEIRVRPGIYLQALDVPRAGTASNPIFLTADAAGVVLDGSDPAYLARGDWRADGGGIFSVPYAGTTRLVCVDSLQRLYHQASLADLQAGANGVAQGYALEAGRLWLRLEDGSSPAGRSVHVGRANVGIFLDASYWRVTGFEVRYFGIASGGAGIRVADATGCLVAANHVHTIGGKNIYLTGAATDNRIEANLCRDPRTSTWPWSASKAHDEEQQGISLRAGRGNVIRFNTIRGTFDGIDTGGDYGVTENIAADTDIDDNQISDTADDALEPETVSGINLRVWRNRVNAVFSGCSISPNTSGPTYVLYNSFIDYRRGGFKFSLSGTAQLWICHNTLTSTVAGAPAVHPSGPYSNIHFRNNILVGSGAAAVSDDAGESLTGDDFDGDLVHSNYAALFRWKGVNYSTLAALRSATGFELVGRSGAPMFVDPASGNYALAAGSPAIDGAIRLPGINDAFSGAAPDMGAFESSGADMVPPANITDLRIGP